MAAMLTSADELANISTNRNISAHDIISSTCQLESYNYTDLTQIAEVRVVYIVAYAVVAMLAVLGNLMVIWTVVSNKHMHTVTNYYIVSLAVSDFLVSLIVMPFKLVEYTAPCEYQLFSSDLLCGVLSYTLPVFVFSSVLTLVAISIERFYAVVYPLDTIKFHSKSRTRKILCCVWLVPAFITVPYAYSKSYTVSMQSDYGAISRQICNDRFDEIDLKLFGGETGAQVRLGYHMFLFVAFYLVPLVVITFTCVAIAVCLLRPIPQDHDLLRRRNSFQKRSYQKREENKRKVAKMVVVVATAFFLSWTPFYVINTIGLFNPFLRQSNFLFTLLNTHLLGFLNSFANPFIYSVMSERFRNSFRNIIYSLCCCLCARARGSYKRKFRSRASTVLSYVTQNSLVHEQEAEISEYSMNRRSRHPPTHAPYKPVTVGVADRGASLAEKRPLRPPAAALTTRVQTLTVTKNGYLNDNDIGVDNTSTTFLEES